MRVLTTLSLGLAFGLMSACDAGGAADAQTVNQPAATGQPAASSQSAPDNQAKPKTQDTVRRRVLPVKEVVSPSQLAPVNPGSSQEAPRPKVLPNWGVRYDESSIGFTGKQTGDEFSGTFSSFKADIVFHPDFMKAASVEAVIDMSSFDAGSKDRNEALPGKEWFSVKAFPQAKFTSYNFTDLGDHKYEAKGELTLRGVSVPVTLPFELDLSEDRTAKMTGSLEIDRSDFGVGQGAWAKGEWVDLNVGIDIIIVADRRG